MAIVVGDIKDSITALLNDTGDLTLEESKEAFATQLADIIKAAIESATITIGAGAIVVTGSAATQNNPSPIVINDGLS